MTGTSVWAVRWDGKLVTSWVDRACWGFTNA
jgi:hypothetical protein